jgi:peptidoglycan L-alanyl-D-glutamate endopeptidase CwlK
MYKLGKRSLERLEGVDERMVAIVKSAIHQSKQDFSVTCGLRSIEEQKKLVAKGASQTMKSKHIDGLAVDLAAWEDGIRWELNLYDEIADAVKSAANDLGVAIRWGAAWHIDSFGDYKGSAEDAMNEYVDLRRSQGRRPFIDAPHFELMV